MLFYLCLVDGEAKAQGGKLGTCTGFEPKQCGSRVYALTGVLLAGAGGHARDTSHPLLFLAGTNTAFGGQIIGPGDARRQTGP